MNIIKGSSRNFEQSKDFKRTDLEARKDYKKRITESTDFEIGDKPVIKNDTGIMRQDD